MPGGLFPRVRLPRDRRHSAPVNIWTIREAVEEAEHEVIAEETQTPSRAQVHPSHREAASQTSTEELWARPALSNPCRLSPRRVTFVCDVVERI